MQSELPCTTDKLHVLYSVQFRSTYEVVSGYLKLYICTQHTQTDIHWLLNPNEATFIGDVHAYTISEVINK